LRDFQEKYKKTQGLEPLKHIAPLRDLQELYQNKHKD